MGSDEGMASHWLMTPSCETSRRMLRIRLRISFLATCREFVIILGFEAVVKGTINRSADCAPGK
jgi:hypothetical protein